MFWIPSPIGEKKGAAPFLIKALSLRGALPQKIKKKSKCTPKVKNEIHFQQIVTSKWIKPSVLLRTYLISLQTNIMMMMTNKVFLSDNKHVAQRT
jgi:UDP-N-acetylmuramyl pentapeptide phosphotransferase/UDP-N-acetylglucosamine-1-phosphate transferase